MNAYEWKKTASGWGMEKRAGDPIYGLRYEGGREWQKERTTSGTLSFRRCEQEMKRSVGEKIRLEMKRRGITGAGSMVDLQYGDATWKGYSTLHVREESYSEGYDENLEPRSGGRRPEERRETRTRYEMELKGVAVYEGGKFSFRGFWRLDENPEKSGCRSFVNDSLWWDIGDYSPTAPKYQRKKSKLPWWRRIF